MDLTGQVFDRLVVITRAPSRKDARWRCRCACGKFVTVTSNKLRSGRTKSCGCWNRDRLVRMHRTHGLSGTKEHRIWKGAKSRCHNKNNPKYALYGARGIYVSDEWRMDFSRFHADMGDCPAGLTLDRIDDNGPYAPWNCRWASPTQQANNTRSNRLVTFKGERHTTAEWARLHGMSASMLQLRLKRGWTVEQALLEPYASGFKRKGRKRGKYRKRLIA